MSRGRADKKPSYKPADSRKALTPKVFRAALVSRMASVSASKRSRCLAAQLEATMWP